MEIDLSLNIDAKEEEVEEEEKEEVDEEEEEEKEQKDDQEHGHDAEEAAEATAGEVDDDNDDDDASVVEVSLQQSIKTEEVLIFINLYKSITFNLSLSLSLCFPNNFVSIGSIALQSIYICSCIAVYDN